MFGLTVLDLALILTLLSYLIYGLRNGFLVTWVASQDSSSGAVAAFFAVPSSATSWRTAAGGLPPSWAPPSC